MHLPGTGYSTRYIETTLDGVEAAPGTRTGIGLPLTGKNYPYFYVVPVPGKVT